MPHVDRYPARGLPARTLARMAPWARRAIVRQVQRTARILEPDAIAALAEPDPAPVVVPTPEDWQNDAILETYEQAPEPDWFEDDDAEDAAAEIVEIVTPARRGARPDYSRFVEAMRDKSRPTAALHEGSRASSSAAIGPQRGLPVAPGREECRQCGIPGFRGCAHQAPYVPAPPPRFIPGDEGPKRKKGAYK